MTTASAQAARAAELKALLGKRDKKLRGRLLIALAVMLIACIFFLLYNSLDSWELIIHFRLRRFAGLFVVASALSAATVIFQTITQNRILSPSVMGFESIYSLISTATVFFLTSAVVALIHPLAMFTLRAALMCACAIFLFTTVLTQRRNSVQILVLVGIVFGSFLRSVTAFMNSIMDPNEFLAVQNANTAGFSAINLEALGICAAVVIACVLFALYKAPTWDILALGRDIATGLGVSYRREVKCALAVSSLMIACATALVGPLLFFGLLIVNITLFSLGSSKTGYLVLGSICLGVLVLIGGQAVLEFVLEMGTVLPVVIEFLGGSLLLAMIVKASRG